MRFLLIWLVLLGGALRADPLRVAAAASALPLAQSVAADLSREGGDVRLSSGSSGALLTQIRHGAPFDLFLSADQARPAALAAEGYGTAQTYALGRLVLWSATPGRVTGAGSLMDGPMAIANPALAPYGTAAQEVLTSYGAAPRLVLGQNVGQAAGMVATGNAPVGLIAAALVPEGGSQWVIPANRHAPIRHDLILLHDSPAARAFIARLSEPARLAAHGFEAPDD